MSTTTSQSSAELCEVLLRQARRCDQWTADYQQRASRESDPGEKAQLERTAELFQSTSCRIRSRLHDGDSAEEVLPIVLKLAAKLKAAQAFNDLELIFRDDNDITIAYEP